MVKIEDNVGPDAPVSSSNLADDVKQEDGVVKEVIAVKVEVKADPAAATNGDVPTNGALAVPVEMKDTKPATGDDDDDDEEDDADEKVPDEDDLEDKLFEKLEHDQEEQALTHPHEQQPNDVKAAPKLLQSAFQKGEVAVEDSESDSEKKSAAVEVAEADPDHHTHARVRNKVTVRKTCISIPSILSSSKHKVTNYEGSAFGSHYRLFLLFCSY
jgi:hypothetical protein